MELKTFVSAALVDIMSGISDAQSKAKASGLGTVRGGSGSTSLKTVKFDIAVTVSDAKESKEGIGVAIASVVLGKQAEKTNSTESASRISFSVDVEYSGF